MYVYLYLFTVCMRIHKYVEAAWCFSQIMHNITYGTAQMPVCVCITRYTHLPVHVHASVAAKG